MRETLEGRIEMHGHRHHETLASKCNLASLLMMSIMMATAAQGQIRRLTAEQMKKTTEAEKLYTEAVEGSREVLGVEHPQTKQIIEAARQAGVEVQAAGRAKASASAAAVPETRRSSTGNDAAIAAALQAAFDADA